MSDETRTELPCEAMKEVEGFIGIPPCPLPAEVAELREERDKLQAEAVTLRKTLGVLLQDCLEEDHGETCLCITCETIKEALAATPTTAALAKELAAGREAIEELAKALFKFITGETYIHTRGADDADETE